MKTTHQKNAQADGASVVSKPYRCIKFGLDVHAASIQVARMIDGATPQPAQKMTPDEFVKWAAKQLLLADKVCSCYEAGPLGYGLHRKLLALGIENIVVRPHVLDEYRVRVKTDKTDALALVKRLDAYVRGNRKAFAVIRVPTEQEEQERAISRQREQLVREVRRVRAQSIKKL
jgi:transposase